MKKLIALLALIMSLCLVFSACGNGGAAQKADDLILAIGDVSPESEAKIITAMAYYDSLTAEQKMEVKNYDVLERANYYLKDLELNTSKYMITPYFDSCLFACADGETDECILRVKANDDIVVNVYPKCTVCGEKQKQTSIRISQSEFNGKDFLQRFESSECANDNCQRISFWYVINVNKLAE